jgi:hypothetical protein
MQDIIEVMVLIDIGVHSEHGNVIRCDIQPRWVKRSIDRWRKSKREISTDLGQM